MCLRYSNICKIYKIKNKQSKIHTSVGREKTRARARKKSNTFRTGKNLTFGELERAGESRKRYAVLENCTILSFRGAINNKIYNKLHPGRDKWGKRIGKW